MTKQDLLKSLNCCTVRHNCNGCPMSGENNCCEKLLKACYIELQEEKK